MTVIEFENDIIVIDAGMMFPREEMLGVDYVIADTAYLQKNAHKILSLIHIYPFEERIRKAEAERTVLYAGRVGRAYDCGFGAKQNRTGRACCGGDTIPDA